MTDFIDDCGSLLCKSNTIIEKSWVEKSSLIVSSTVGAEYLYDNQYYFPIIFLETWKNASNY